MPAPNRRPSRGRRVTALAVALLCSVSSAVQTQVTGLTIDAPPRLSPVAARIHAMDLARLAQDLDRAGLTLPSDIRLRLIPEDDDAARSLPRWIVGVALGPHDIVIFPQRVLPYPYDSVESVFRHEVAHLALDARAGGRPLPRWFHEGVAMSVDTGWGVPARLRLLIEMVRNPGTADLARLFASDAQPDAAQAYGLSAALIADVRRRHGEGVPGAVAARVAGGMPFDRAFEVEIGETPDAAAARAWAAYRRSTTWIPSLTSGATVWGLIMLLAGAAYVTQRRRRTRRRRQWDDEDAATRPEAPGPE